MASKKTGHYRGYNEKARTIPGPGSSAAPSGLPVPIQNRQGAPMQYQFHPQYTVPYPHPLPDNVDALVLRLYESLKPSLQTMHDVNIKIGQDQDSAVAALSKELTELRTETAEKHKQLSERLDSMHKLQIDTLKGLSIYTKGLDNVIGNRSGSKSLTERLDEISFTVGELLERARDPGANGFESPPQQTSSKVPEIIVLDETPEPEPVSVKESTAPQTRKQASLTRTFASAQIGTTPTPEPPLRKDAATTPIRTSYCNQGNTPRTPTPQPPQRIFASVEVCTSPGAARVERSASPMKVTYVETAVDTASMLDDDVESGSSSSKYVTVASSSRRQSSATTLVGDGTLPHLSPKVGSVDIPDDFDPPALEYIDDPFPVLIPGEQTIASELENCHFTGHCTANPNLSSTTISNSFSPVDWSNEDLASNAGGESRSPRELSQPMTKQETIASKKQMAVFHPDTSPQIAKSFSLLKDHDLPPDGTIASLRRDALGDSFAGPLTSTPRPTLPYYSRPSVSPMPSPAPSRSSSPPALKNGGDTNRLSIVQQTEVKATGTSLELSSADSTARSAVEPAEEVVAPSLTPVEHERDTTLSPTTLAEETLVSDLVMQAEPSPVQSTFEYHLSEEETSVDPSLTAVDPQSSLEDLLVSSISRAFSSPPPISFLPQSTPSEDTSSSTPPPSPPALFPVAVSGISPDVSSPPKNEPPRTVRVSRSPRRSSPVAARVNVDLFQSPIYISSTSPSPTRTKQSPRVFPSALAKFINDDDDTAIIPASKMKKLSDKSKEKEADRAPPRLNLSTLAIRSRENRAATRVRKRKEKPKTEEEEPPLKRARQRKSIDKEKEKERHSTPVHRKEKGKGKEKGIVSVKEASHSLTKKKGKQRKSSVMQVKWPSIKQPKGELFNKRLIKCDMCLIWYHYGCVGISNPDDPRLKESFTFVCPPCDVGSTSTHPVQTDGASCARPDCTLDTASENEYYVAGIIGRKTKVEGGYGRKFLWLLKWEGYSISSSTWESEESMNDPQKLIEDFEEIATREGWDLEKDPHCTILLREAVAAGWQSDEDAEY